MPAGAAPCGCHEAALLSHQDTTELFHAAILPARVKEIMTKFKERYCLHSFQIEAGSSITRAEGTVAKQRSIAEMGTGMQKVEHS